MASRGGKGKNLRRVRRRIGLTFEPDRGKRLPAALKSAESRKNSWSKIHPGPKLIGLKIRNKSLGHKGIEHKKKNGSNKTATFSIDPGGLAGSSKDRKSGQPSPGGRPHGKGL